MTTALAEFPNSALTLVGHALFIASTMTFTGLDKRTMLGYIAVTTVSLVVQALPRVAQQWFPSVGIIATSGVDKRSDIAAGFMIIVTQATSI